MKTIKFAVIVLLLAGNFSCGEKKEEEFGDPKELSFTEYPLSGTDYNWTNLNYDNKVIIINSKNELEKYIAGIEGSYPEIDFSKYTLLLASGCVSGAGVGSVSKKLVNTETNTFVLYIEVVMNDETIGGDGWRISIITDKLNANSQITLNVETIKN